jgi:hypothetical protein
MLSSIATYGRGHNHTAPISLMVMCRQSRAVLEGKYDYYHPCRHRPGVPADPVKILRDAFSNALKDPELPGKAEKALLETNWSTGEQVQDMARELIDQSKPAFES